ncbi:MAG: GntR family transcriptional regulator [Albidovulum sp.]|nr:GntR family transcriptional regulator [Albidovulum sp.]
MGLRVALTDDIAIDRSNGLVDRLRVDILAGVFPGGARLKAGELARRYEVSTIPVREALRQLHGEGVIEFTPNKGARVRVLDETFIDSLYELREAIEVLQVRKLTRHRTSADVATLKSMETEFEREFQAGEWHKCQAVNRMIHGYIAERAGNELALQMMLRHSDLITALRSEFGYTRERLQDIIQEHRRLIDAIESMDVDRAGEEASRHVRSARDSLLAQIRLKKTRKRFAFP